MQASDNASSENEPMLTPNSPAPSELTIPGIPLVLDPHQDCPRESLRAERSSTSIGAVAACRVGP
eukprot:6088834-Pleurochrysis_carterae.AAC.1